MPRKPSVILTPSEQKAVAKEAKAAVKEAGNALSVLERDRDALVKAHNKAVKDLTKSHEQDLKAKDKAIGDARKVLNRAEAANTLANPPKAEPSPVAE